MYVLVVDDDDAVRAAMVSLLEQAGHTTCWASTGDGALKLLRSERVDLMLLDIGLPDRNGLEVRREQLSDVDIASVPVIVVSALSPEDVRAMSTSNPMATVQLIMSKPVDGDMLLRAIGHIGELKKIY
jgi:CheY-like chemotaxis protein